MECLWSVFPARQLIFSLERYEAVMEAYVSGLEQYEGDLSKVASVASFFISRVDVEVRRPFSGPLTSHPRCCFR